MLITSFSENDEDNLEKLSLKKRKNFKENKNNKTSKYFSKKIEMNSINNFDEENNKCNLESKCDELYSEINSDSNNDIIKEVNKDKETASADNLSPEKHTFKDTCQKYDTNCDLKESLNKHQKNLVIICIPNGGAYEYSINVNTN